MSPLSFLHFNYLNLFLVSLAKGLFILLTLFKEPTLGFIGLSLLFLCSSFYFISALISFYFHSFAAFGFSSVFFSFSKFCIVTLLI